MRSAWWVVGGIAALAAACGMGARAQEQPRAEYGFEEDVQGFSAITFKDGALMPDASATVSVAKELAKNGKGALLYSFKAEPGAFRTLLAQAKLPAGTQAVRFWARSGNATSVFFALREEGGATYHVPCYVPANEWVAVSANLSEFEPADQGTDANGKLDADQVVGIGVSDVAVLLSNNPEVAKLLPNLQGQRTLWLDDLQFSGATVPQSTGSVKEPGPAFLVDNFEAGSIRWTPARVVFAAPPTFEIFPPDISLKVLPEAAGPGMARTAVEPGGKGLRFSYKRRPQEVLALVRSLEKEDLSKADRLRLHLRVSQKSLLIVQIKEKDESEYQFPLLPDDVVGWRELSLPFSELGLAEQSKDENNKLDASQIKEITILDASSFLQMPEAEVTLDLDAVYFGTK